MSKRKLSQMRNAAKSTVASPSFAQSLTDCVKLASPHPDVVMPVMGFGTYRLGKNRVESAVSDALSIGYRALDTAFIYGGETTETLVGKALQRVTADGALQRDDIFVISKHWRKYHGYEPTWECLRLSLQRLQVDHIDLWLMHWPGPAWTTMARRKDVVEDDPWQYSNVSAQEMAKLRAETWRAMEDACRQGKVRAIGVCNMTKEHLNKLKETATLWPPAVNQVECHPLHPQIELREYCRQQGIVLQAYASLGGQDTGKEAWKQLLGKPAPRFDQKGKKLKDKIDLLHAGPVLSLSEDLERSPAQVLLRWGLERGCTLVPKTSSKDRMMENAAIFDFEIGEDRLQTLEDELRLRVRQLNPAEKVDQLTRLCWRSDPLRHLDFE